MNVPNFSGLLKLVKRDLVRAWAAGEFELIVSPGIIEVAGPRLSIRPIAAARRTIEFSSLGTDPCPARPWAVSRNHTIPFSAVCRR